MKVCIISKYPPIQGGISAKTYWLARGLARAGQEIHIVTNGNCVEREYSIDDDYAESVPNLAVHFVSPDVPWHIPESRLYTPRLLDKALEVAEARRFDVIDTNYLVPYGIVGHLFSKITGVPHVLRHGGSDIAKFFQQGLLKHLLKATIQNASAIVTDENNRSLFETSNRNVHVVPRYIPDEEFFRPTSVSHATPTFAYVGKINHYWKYKSLDKLVDLFSGIREEHTLLFIAQGKGFGEFSRYVERHDLRTHRFDKFVHPAKVPEALDSLDYLVYFSQDNPIKDFSNIVCEALWSGIPLITDERTDLSRYTQYLGVGLEKQIIRLNLDVIEDARDKVATLVREWKGSSRCTNEVGYNFSRYVADNLKVYDRL